MNCRQCQNDLYEYLEGSLPTGAQAAAEKHLEECATCRQRAQEEREVARSLAEGFRRATEGLTLPAEVGRRVMAAVAGERTARGENLSEQLVGALGGGTERGEHPTSNNQHRTSKRRALVVHWMLGVGCWLLGVFRAHGREESTGSFWERLAWPAALAASAAVLVAGWVLLMPLGGQGPGRPQPRLARGGISVQLSFVTPVYTFRHEDGFVVDALTGQTTEINEWLSRKRPASTNQERKLLI